MWLVWVGKWGREERVCHGIEVALVVKSVI